MFGMTDTSFNPFNIRDIKELKYANLSPHQNPFYAKEGDSGFDLRAWIKDGGSVTLQPLERKLIDTGLYFEIPKYTEIQVRPRSGAALKLGLSVCNTPGTVDFGYRNSVGVIVINLSNEPITINDGDRIAQAVLCPVFNSQLVQLTEIDKVSTDTDRGEDGFGSTGLN